MPTPNTPTLDELRTLLDTNAYAVEEAVLRIYDRQTTDEKSARVTAHSNGMGFSAFDAELLSSFAEQIRANRYNRRNGERLTDKQLALARKKIKRYVRQLQVCAAAKSPSPATEVAA